MSDLISRQAAIDALKREEALTRAFGYGVVIDTIREQPSAQPEGINYVKFSEENYEKIAEQLRKIPIVLTLSEPEIIRCKDCEWWEKQKDSLQGRCELMQMYPTGAWYCGNAQRRETDG